MAPITGSHSVIDKPLSVKRVKPPTVIITTIKPTKLHNQRRTQCRSPLPARAIAPALALVIFVSLPTSSKIFRLFAMFKPFVSSQVRAEKSAFNHALSNGPFGAWCHAAFAHRLWSAAYATTGCADELSYWQPWFLERKNLLYQVVAQNVRPISRLQARWPILILSPEPQVAPPRPPAFATHS